MTDVKIARDKLIGDTRAVIDDAQVLLRAAGEQENAGRTANAWAYAYPWRAVGIAAGFGLLVGFVVGRR